MKKIASEIFFFLHNLLLKIRQKTVKIFKLIKKYDIIYIVEVVNMESRMNKYQEFDIEEFQRSKKNANLYKEVYGNYDDFDDLPIPENTNEIDIENLKSLVGSRTSRRKAEFESRDINTEEDQIVMPNEKE